jgi:hypothetical protein
VVGAPGGRAFGAHRINIEPTILRKKIEDARGARHWNSEKPGDTGLTASIRESDAAAPEEPQSIMPEGN